MAVIDIKGMHLQAGDLVVCVTNDISHYGVRCNHIYKIKEIKQLQETVRIEGTDDIIFAGTNFLKLMDIDKYTSSPNYEEMALRVSQLINSKPWSPTKQQLIDAMKGN